MEVTLKSNTGVGQEVDKSSLLDEVVFRVDAHVLDLLLGRHEPLHLGLLSLISPLGNELLGLVAGVDVVEVGELGTNDEGEVADLSNTQVESKDVLVMEDHSSDPLVVGPSTHAGEGGDGTDVEEEEEDATAGAGEGLVMRRDLLGTNSLHEGLHVVVVAEGDGVLSTVVRVFVTLTHGVELVSVVSLSVLLLVLGFLTNYEKI